ncbi:V-type ATPase subunit family protein [Dictyocaulus viviparus]|uniref:V-type proton ATPase subunit a n=1 Tax=Dictyocaulus viviparus TaxID=29172 RepID=A0A0D8Y0C2_DICVI|nr:V-type ATPase subunit family protein [Dictyocaulus viviparus]
MGSIYRSEVMSHCQIFLQVDSAYHCVAELGELGLVQFLDLNAEMTSYQRKFVNEIRRCEDMERKLHFIEAEILKDDVAIEDYDEHIPAPQPKNMLEMETTRRDAAVSISVAFKGEAGPFTVGYMNDIEKEYRGENELNKSRIGHWLFQSVDYDIKMLITVFWNCSGTVCHTVVELLRIFPLQNMSGSTVHAVLNEMQTNHIPPTYFKLNKFTQGFQNIVDAYGIANYREVNPAPWSIITFPFLFAVMFGDSGHGIVMLLAALTFIVFEKKLISMKIKDEIFNTFFGGRYVVLLMGMFSIYTGLLYNDIYSKSINIFGSSWKNPYSLSLLKSLEEDGYSKNQTVDLTWSPQYAFDSDLASYPFGVDPIWNIAKNKLNFLNPLKMKTSIILGIGQMAFGLVLSLCNHIHNRSFVDIFFVFVPQCFFLGSIFVYLCVMVVLKWIFFYVNPTFIFGRLYPGSNCAPSLLIGLINMFMLKAREVGYYNAWKLGLRQTEQIKQ